MSVEPSFPPPSLELLSPEQCRDLLATARVGRVAVSVGALPAILPVNFVMWNADVLYRTVPGTKLDAASAGSVVAFEVDHWDDDGRSGWSVMVQGHAREVTDPDELEAVVALPLESWALDGQADRFVLVETSVVTGRRFRRQP